MTAKPIPQVADQTGEDFARMSDAELLSHMQEYQNLSDKETDPYWKNIYSVCWSLANQVYHMRHHK